MNSFDLTNPNTPLMIIPLLFLMFFAALMGGCAAVSATPGADPQAVAAKTGQVQALPAPIFASDLSPAAPQPDPSSIAPGLAVVYFRNFFERHLDLLPAGDFARLVGRKGKPIPDLNHAFDKEAVFDSGEKRGIGMRLNGLINFKQTGRYTLQAFVNDGIRVYIDDRLVIDEPKWQKQGDRFSNQALLDIQTTGWYPIRVEYFQRKGTATVKLLWRMPDSEDLTPIPAQVYAHLPSSE
jgi:hypothetical protein